MISPSHLKRHIIRPVLEAMSLGGTVAENLVLGTIMHESTIGNVTYLRQVTASGDGPAYGIGMMEDPTTKDLFQRFLELPKNARIKQVSRNYLLPGDLTPQLCGNLYLMAFAVRLRYYMSPKALPENDARAMCAMWKEVYNTRLGKGRVDEATISTWRQAMVA